MAVEGPNYGKARPKMARKGAQAESRDGKQTGALSASRLVLVVVRDSAEGGKIVGALQSRGFPSVLASTASQALFWARVSVPALVLIDMDVQGARLLLGELRRGGRLVVVRTDDQDERVWALESGCLDAFPHSVGPEETAAKMARSVRSHRIHPPGRVMAGPLTVDLSARRLLWKEKQVAVSPLLLDLAAYLAARAGQLTPVRVLLEDVWGEPWADPSKVHQAIHRLRGYLRERGGSHFLVGQRGHGYGVFVDPPTVGREPGAALTS
jgi:DNA-binding response OmpR family regulator